MLDRPAATEAHARPPQPIRDVFKQCQRLQAGSTALSEDWVAVPATLKAQSLGSIRQILDEFLDTEQDEYRTHAQVASAVKCYTHQHIEGLYLLPGLLTLPVQLTLLNRLFDRDLLDSNHKTNVHAHYKLRYPSDIGASSFFAADKDVSFEAIDPGQHRSLPVGTFLERKLRWMTLGGQYDWTKKLYPEERPPAFPADIKRLVEGLFPMKAEAAIVNLYTPGDTLSLHRDISELCDQPLVSLSIGCDCIFVVGLEDDSGTSQVAKMTLKSGDAVLMSGRSRFAWHGVPKVVPGTCPEELKSWPGEKYPQWQDWMSRKRINVNIRQMYD